VNAACTVLFIVMVIPRSHSIFVVCLTIINSVIAFNQHRITIPYPKKKKKKEEEEMNMKKLIPIVTAIALALSVGVAYAYDQTSPMSADDMRSTVLDDNVTYVPLDNAVTFSGLNETGSQCMTEGGAGAGGMSGEKMGGIVQDDQFAYSAPNNGVSFSTEIPAPSCSWALGISPELNNGITIPGGNQ
jgi:hypothetical protein